MSKRDASHISVPWRGIDCFNTARSFILNTGIFPSPGGALIVSWLIGKPLLSLDFRPLTGRWLFHIMVLDQFVPWQISVPWRGIDCFGSRVITMMLFWDFRPLAGYWLFQLYHNKMIELYYFRPLAGYWLFRQMCIKFSCIFAKHIKSVFIITCVLLQVKQICIKLSMKSIALL